MRVCLIAEKHSLGCFVLPHILELHPGLNQDAFACAFVSPYVHLNACFRYPRGLSFADYPFTGEAVYEPFSLMPTWTQFSKPSLGFLPTEFDDGTGITHYRFLQPPPMDDLQPEVVRRLKAADVIYAAMGPGQSSTLALERCVSGLGLHVQRLEIPRIYDLSRVALRKAFASPSGTTDGWYGRHISEATVRRRFDFGYQVNALAVHGRAMRLAGAASDAQVPSKYGLQILYDMRRGPPLKEGQLMDRMMGWEGSGRYEYTGNGMGRVVSRMTIPGSLVRSGLVDDLGGGILTVSPLGHRFLGTLHPDSEDRDLPFRLEIWKAAPDGVSRVDRYLRTFFGRQIRYQARRIDFSAGRAVI